MENGDLGKQQISSVESHLKELLKNMNILKNPLFVLRKLIETKTPFITYHENNGSIYLFKYRGANSISVLNTVSHFDTYMPYLFVIGRQDYVVIGFSKGDSPGTEDGIPFKLRVD